MNLISVRLSFVSSSNKLSNLMRGSLETLICSQAGQKL